MTQYDLRSIQNPVKNLRWSSIVDVWQRFEYASVIRILSYRQLSGQLPPVRIRVQHQGWDAIYLGGNCPRTLSHICRKSSLISKDNLIKLAEKRVNLFRFSLHNSRRELQIYYSKKIYYSQKITVTHDYRSYFCKLLNLDDNS